MINTIVLMGRITHSLEVKKTPADKLVLNFSIAVERSFGKERVTDFFDCVAWHSTAEFIAKYFKKGDMIAVVGQMTTRDYTGKDGTKKKAYEVLVGQVSFCGGKKDGETTSEAPTWVAPTEATEAPAESAEAGKEIPNVGEYVTFDPDAELPF